MKTKNDLLTADQARQKMQGAEDRLLESINREIETAASKGATTARVWTCLAEQDRPPTQVVKALTDAGYQADAEWTNINEWKINISWRKNIIK